jgi:hypothetical protein
MLAALSRGKISAEVLDTQAVECRFAVRARVFSYPEGVCAAWVMIAVHFA